MVHTINGVCLVQAQNQQRRIVITMVRNRNTAAKTTESFIFWSIEWNGTLDISTTLWALLETLHLDYKRTVISLQVCHPSER